MPDRSELVPGQRYKITLFGCCVEGELEGVFVDWILDDEGEIDTLKFDIGTIRPAWGHWETTEIEGDMIETERPGVAANHKINSHNLAF